MAIQLQFLALKDGQPYLDSTINGLEDSDLEVILATYQALLGLVSATESDIWKAMVGEVKDHISENVRKFVLQQKAAAMAAELTVEMPSLTVL
jgi:hypothetical protein